MKTKYTILLFYKYTTVPDPAAAVIEHRALCESLQLKGRILIAEEGINATIEGLYEDIEKYITAMNDHAYFSGINFKKSEGTGNAFSKLSIRARKEIVTAGLPNLHPKKVTGKYLSADELHTWFTTGKEFYIVDMRNDFEYSVGHFAGFIPSGMKHFFELPEILPRLEHLKNKTIVTVCTGGIRCEKASGFLVTSGFTDVYQLQDGIVTYMEKYPNEYFKGKLYVFDSRITVGFNLDDPKHEVVGTCFHCDAPCDTFVNCDFLECHYHYLSCNECKDTEIGLYFCKNACKTAFLKTKSEQTINPSM
jgi:UPF0176 protein